MNGKTDPDDMLLELTVGEAMLYVLVLNRFRGVGCRVRVHGPK